MKKLLSITLLCLFTVGCAHGSLTETKFKGKTKGFNPYGDGELQTLRVSAYGTSEKIVDKVIKEYLAIRKQVLLEGNQ